MISIFISWSGHLANLLAVATKDWIQDLFTKDVEVFISQDIAKGKSWDPEIIRNLKQSAIGIICLTAENLQSNWLHFEAGALAVNMDESKVIPVLFNVTNTDLQLPLSRFQTAKFNKEELRKLIISINAAFGEERYNEPRLIKHFDRIWEDFETTITTILSNHSASGAVVKRPTEDILEETLTLVRKMSNDSDRNIGHSKNIQNAIKKHLGTTYQFHVAAIRANDTAIYSYLWNLYNFYLSIIEELDMDNKADLKARLLSGREEIIAIVRKNEPGMFDDLSAKQAPAEESK